MWDIFGKFFKKEESNKNIKKVERTINNKELILKKNIKNLERREVKEIDTSLLNKNYRIDYKNSLNNEQLRALTSIEGKYLVIAGAGSGKTRTIIYRTAFLLELGIKEENVLMLTFTRKAGDEMKTRLESLLKKRVGVEIGTFHSFCLKLMIKNKILFNLKDITIIDDNQKIKIVNKIIKKRMIEFKKFDLEQEKVLNIIEAISKGKNIDKILCEKEKIYKENLKIIIKDYKKYKEINQFFDFNDLIDRVVLKLKVDINFRRYLQEKYKFIVVDEYQDTDVRQREILKMLCGKNGNLMVVGDDYQSIYGFRGAEFENILRFNEDFPESQLIKLETNYRSTNEIVEYCNRIASKFALKYNKISKSIGKSGKKPEILKFKNENIQNMFILEKIKKFHQLGITYDEIAIIYRNRYGVAKLEKFLIENSIPYRKNLEKAEGEKVSLISVHSSKGLEWRVVFIPMMLEGVFPSSLSSENLEEEKRLYYVACSRSKEFLYLLYPEYFYEKLGYFNKKSSFLNI